MPDPVCVVLHAPDPARLPAAVADWATALRKLGRPAELLAVADAHTELDGARVLTAPGGGFGAVMRAAVAATDAPVLAVCTLDYPYTPGDLAGLLAELDTEQEVIVGRLRPAVVVGLRGGRPAPVFWRAVGGLYRLLARVCCGFRPETPPGWLGAGNHTRSWLGWLVFANPLPDPGSGLVAYRRELFDLFPVQADGDFARIEVLAKAGFCTQLVGSVLLSPSPAAVPPGRWAGWWRVFRRPAFTPQRPLCGDPVPATAVPLADG